jgi:hypothetical protein
MKTLKQMSEPSPSVSIVELHGGLQAALEDRNSKEFTLQHECWILLKKIISAAADADDHSMVGKITEYLEEMFARELGSVHAHDIKRAAQKYAPPAIRPLVVVQDGP